MKKSSLVPAFAALAALALAALLAACAAGDNRITLRYAPSVSARTCSGAVALAGVLDARADRMLGRNEHFAFRPEGRDVDEWLRASLAEELAARGCRVLDADAADASAPVVAGTVQAAALVADGMNHALDLKFTLTLTRGGDTVFKKTYSGRWERMVPLPSREESEAMFASALRELLASAASDLEPLLGP